MVKSIGWLLSPAQTARYGYDARSLYLMGHSCGAHMVALLALQYEKYLSPILPGGDTLKGCVGVQGIYDLDLIVKDFPSYVGDVEIAFTKDRNNWESPQVLGSAGSSSTAPWLVIHSKEDDWVNLAQAENFVGHLQELRIDAKLDTDVNGDHMKVIRLIGMEGFEKEDKVLPHVLDFIKCSVK